jgi:beta-phosphoglucomutase-like phosphatase (HAD superfamily)
MNVLNLVDLQNFQVTHVLFDMDGLLLDSNRLYLETTKAILARHGKVFDPVFHATTIGRRHKENTPNIIKHYGDFLTKEIYPYNASEVAPYNVNACC